MEMMKQGAMLTVLSTLLTALAWPATLLVLTDFIDSKWTIALNRFFFLLDCGKSTCDEKEETLYLQPKCLLLLFE